MNTLLFLDEPLTVIFVAILSWPVYKYLAKVFFGEQYEKLGQVVKYVIQWDWTSAKQGKFWEDWDASLKFNVFLIMCIGWVVAVAELLCRYKLS